MSINLGEILSGIIGGIGRLIGELRKSRVAIQFMKLAASAIVSAVAVYLGAIGVGVTSREAALSAATAAAVVLIYSSLREGLDLRIPLWILKLIQKRTLPEGWLGSGQYALVWSGSRVVLEADKEAKFWARGTVPDSVVISVAGTVKVDLASGSLSESFVASQPMAKRVKTLKPGAPATITLTVVSEKAVISEFATIPQTFPPLLQPEEEDVVSPGT